MKPSQYIFNRKILTFLLCMQAVTLCAQPNAKHSRGEIDRYQYSGPYLLLQTQRSQLFPEIDQQADFTWPKLEYADQLIDEGLYIDAYAYLKGLAGESDYTTEQYLATQLSRISLATGDPGRADLHLAQYLEASKGTGTVVDPTDQGETYYWAAIVQLHQANPSTSKARELLGRYLQSQTNQDYRRSAMLIVGLIEETMGNDEVALDYYSRILEEVSQDDRITEIASLRAAQCLLLAGEYEQSLGRIQGRMYQSPQTKYEAQLLIGNAYTELGNYTDAERTYLDLLRVNDRRYTITAAIKLARLYSRVDRHDAATRIYNEMAVDTTMPEVRMVAEYGAACEELHAQQTDTPTLALQRIASDSAHLMRYAAAYTLALHEYGEGEYENAIQTIGPVAGRFTSLSDRGQAYLLYASAATAREDYVAAEKYADSAEILLKTGNKRLTGKDWRNLTAQMIGAIARINNGRGSEAIPVLNRLLEDTLSPRNRSEVLYWLGEAYYRTGLNKAAITALNELLNSNPSTNRMNDALYTIAWAYYRQKDFTKAASAFSTFIKAFPLSDRVPEARMAYADALYLKGEYTESSAGYSDLLQSDISGDMKRRAAYQKVLANYKAGNNDSASVLAIAFIRKENQSEFRRDARLIAAASSLRKEDYSAAIMNARSLIGDSNTVALQMATALSIYGDAYKGIGDAEKEESAQSLASEIKAGSPSVDNNNREISFSDVRLEEAKADIYYESGNYTEALHRYNAIADVVTPLSERVNIWLKMSEAYLKNGETAKAHSAFEKIYPDLDSVQLTMENVQRALQVCQSQGDTNQAEKILAGYLQQTKDSLNLTSLQMFHAKQLLQRGEQSTADSLLKTVGENITDAKFDLAQQLELAEVFSGSGMKENAGKVASEIESKMAIAGKRERIDLKTILRLADIQFSSGQFKEAANNYEYVMARWVASEQEDRRIRYQLARAYEKTNREDQARQIYKELLDSGMKDGVDHQASERMEALNTL